jgi:hypothetical protein
VPSLVSNLDEAQYRQAAGFSSSDLKSFATSPTPLHFHLQKKKESSSLSFGRLAHILCFEPHRDNEYSVIQGRKCKSTPSNAIKENEWRRAKSIAKNVRCHSFFHRYLQEGNAEESAFWMDAEGYQCKARFDFRNEKQKIIFDLKTSQSSDPIHRFGFKKFAQNFRYDIQAAHYLDAAKSCTGDEYRFLIIAVENDHPHTLSVCEFDVQTIEEARRNIAQIKEEITYRKSNGIWDSWDPRIHTIGFSKGEY